MWVGRFGCGEQLERVAPPTAEELRLLRDVLDPKRLYLGN